MSSKRKKSRAAARTAARPSGYEAALAATPYAKQARAGKQKPVAKKGGRRGMVGRKAAPAFGTPAAYRQCAATARDTAKRPAQRITALRELTSGVLDDAKRFSAVLGILTNANEPAAVRLAAL